MGFRRSADEEELSGFGFVGGDDAVERAFAENDVSAIGWHFEIMLWSDAVAEPRGGDAWLHEDDAFCFQLSGDAKQGEMGAVAGGDDVVRFGQGCALSAGIAHAREQGCRGINADEMNFRRGLAHHRFGQAEGLVFVAGFAIADDQQLEGFLQRR